MRRTQKIKLFGQIKTDNSRWVGIQKTLLQSLVKGVISISKQIPVNRIHLSIK
jgi:hypothetical protein